jgi:DNA-binding transcriptional ArsR family regulator
MPTPLHQLKAEFFKSLGHPLRIRILELLSDRERSVGQMLPELGVEASNLSQQLAVLRRSGLVTTRRRASTVYYSLANPMIAELLAVARHILATMLTDQIELLSDLHAETLADEVLTSSTPTGRRAARARAG